MVVLAVITTALALYSLRDYSNGPVYFTWIGAVFAVSVAQGPAKAWVPAAGSTAVILVAGFYSAGVEAALLTLGASTVALRHAFADQWQHRLPNGQTLGPRVFAADPAHQRRLSVSVFGHRFRPIRDQAGVAGASLHRLRHGV